MKRTDAQKQEPTRAARSNQPFFGTKSATAFFATGQSVQRDPFFQPANNSLTTPIQAKLTVGAVGDQYEQEADRVASEVVDRINNPSVQQGGDTQSVQRMGQDEDEVQMQRLSESIQRVEQEEEKLQMKPIAETIQRMGKEDEELQMKSAIADTAKGGDASPDLESSIQQARGSGQPIDKNVRVPLEQAFGADFSGVRVHTDAKSDQLNRSIQAKAFTTGQDVFFRQGAYEPGSRSGQELIAHELTHVVQQNGRAQIQTRRSNDVRGSEDTSTSGVAGYSTPIHKQVWSGAHNQPRVAQRSVQRQLTVKNVDYNPDDNEFHHARAGTINDATVVAEIDKKLPNLRSTKEATARKQKVKGVLQAIAQETIERDDVPGLSEEIFTRFETIWQQTVKGALPRTAKDDFIAIFTNKIKTNLKDVVFGRGLQDREDKKRFNELIKRSQLTSVRKAVPSEIEWSAVTKYDSGIVDTINAFEGTLDQINNRPPIGAPPSDAVLGPEIGELGNAGYRDTHKNRAGWLQAEPPLAQAPSGLNARSALPIWWLTQNEPSTYLELNGGQIVSRVVYNHRQRAYYATMHYASIGGYNPFFHILNVPLQF